MEDKKERILTIAEQQFARFGFRKTTMDDIAKAVRMSKSTLYYYFKNKEDLLAEVMRKESRILRQKLHEALRNAETPQEKIRNYALTRMKHLKELSNYYTMLTEEYFVYYTFIEQEREEFTHYEVNTLTGIVCEGITHGVFASQDAGTTARMIVFVLKGLEYPIFIENGTEKMEHEINRMLNMLFKGLESR